MRATVRDSEAIRAVSPEDIQQYLASHNWTAAPQTGRLGTTYTQRIDGNEYELLVPLTKELGDFRERIAEILQTLEIAENVLSCKCL